MVAHVLLEGFVAQQETESALCVHVDGLLQIQVFEWNDMFGWCSAFVLEDGEMKLVIHDPVIVHEQNGAIFQK